MSELQLPESTPKLRSLLVKLRDKRRLRQRMRKQSLAKRLILSLRSRAVVLEKSDFRCHICGGLITEDGWQADHVLAHADGGNHSLENYLPAHRLCNAYRWDYAPEEIQWILKIGVWARKQMEISGPLGSQMLERFYAYECQRENRRRSGPRK